MNGHRVRVTSSLVLVLLLAGPPNSNGAVICQWVDDTGRTQMSDTVPLKYRNAAKCVDSRQFELTPEARAAARARQAALLERAASSASASASAASQPTGSAQVAPAPNMAMPDLSNCEAWWRAFLASRDCFAGFQKGSGLGGSLRPGAHAACGPEIPNPDPKCPQKWQ